MEKITITESGHGYFVEQGNKISDELWWDEMLALVTSLTMPEPSPCLQWMNKKEETYKFKNGDFVAMEVTHKNGDKTKWIFVFNSFGDGKIYFHVGLNPSKNLFRECLSGWYGLLSKDNTEVFRLATEEEKQLLLDAMHKADKDWDAEKKEVVEYCWKPKDSETYYYCLDPWSTLHYVPCETKFYSNNECDVTRLKSGNCFQIKEQCSAYCDKLNKRNLSNE